MKRATLAICMLVIIGIPFAYIGSHRLRQHYDHIQTKSPDEDPALIPTVKQMQKLVYKFQSDPLATYSVIMRSSALHVGPEVAVEYGKLLAIHPDDPYIQSAYAYSHFMAVGPLSENYFIANPSPLVNTLRMDAMKATYYRSQAQKSMAQSSIIRFECALPDYFSAEADPSTVMQQEEAAVNNLRQVVKDQPKWADAHYWLAYVLDSYATSIYSIRNGENKEVKTMPLAKEMLAELQLAEKIDPHWHNDCLGLYPYAYQWLKQKQLAAHYLDLYFQARPSETKNAGMMTWRQQLAEGIK